jgi:diacylglycerol kinase family enzyme
LRALLVYNPNATTTTPAVTDVIATALSAQLKLHVEATKRRDHASYLAAGAVHEGYEVVIALGGDGTVNEVMQGVARTPVKLAIIPGGSTNVWARTLGLPNDPVEATAAILEKLRTHQDRRVNLGTANGRYFGFNIGYGFDAEVVRHVEQRHVLKRTVRQISFLYCGLLAYWGRYGKRGRNITVTAAGEEPVTGLRTAVCCNSDPFTYLGRWPARLCPEADLDLGLDVTALNRYGLFTLLHLAETALRTDEVAALRSVRTWHDRDHYVLDSPVPLPLQIDGDYVGEETRVELKAVRKALTVVA